MITGHVVVINAWQANVCFIGLSLRQRLDTLSKWSGGRRTGKATYRLWDSFAITLLGSPRRTTTTWMAQLGKSPIHFLLPPCVYLRAPPELGWPDKKWFSVVSRGNIQSTLTWGDDGQIVFGLWVHLIPVVAMELFRRGFTRIKSDLLSLLRLVWRSACGFLQTTIYV